MLRKLIIRVDGLARRLPDSDPRKDELRSRAAALGQECGCRMGGVFLVAALALALAYVIASGGPDITAGLMGIGFVFAMSLLGKAVGLTVARLKLLAVRRAVERRLSERQVPHVDVH